MREHLRRPSGDPSWCDTLRSDFTHKGVNTRQLNEYRSQLGARGKTATHTVTADKVLARNKERERERETESSGWNMYEVVYNVCRQWWCQPLRGGTHGHQGRRKTAVTSWWTRDAQRLFSFFVFLTPQLHLCSYSSSPPSGPDAPPPALESDLQGVMWHAFEFSHQVSPRQHPHSCNWLFPLSIMLLIIFVILWSVFSSVIK